MKLVYFERFALQNMLTSCGRKTIRGFQILYSTLINFV